MDIAACCVLVASSGFVILMRMLEARSKSEYCMKLQDSDLLKVVIGMPGQTYSEPCSSQ